MTVGEGVAVGSLIISSIGFMWKMSSDIKSIVQDEGSKRSRIYSRIDEEKAKADNKFITKETCGTHMGYTNKTLDEIKVDVKKLLSRSGEV